MKDKHLSDLKFSALNLHPDLLKGIEAAGFEYCTPIQELTLPLALGGKDVAGQAQTGTGKTAAFLLATMQRLIVEAQKTNASTADAKTDAEAKSADQQSSNAEKMAESAEKTDKDQPAKGKGKGKKADASSADAKTDPDAKPDEQQPSDAGQQAESAKSTDADKPTKSKKSKARDKKAIGALILAPTRELAIQIHKDAKELSKYTNLKLGLAYGGTGYESQRKTIESGVDILIGTPGRVIDYFKQGVFHLNNIQVAVMDEADRMFDLGFISDIRYLLRRMPEADSRLNLLFSATLSHRVDEMSYEHMNAPEAVKVESEMVVTRIEEAAYYPAQNEKITLLINLLKKSKGERALVFVNTKHEAGKISDWLEANELNVAILSGDVPQDRREKLLKKFHDGLVDILVATDVAARGLHIPDVSYVYNYDLPQDAEDYVHRTGRTARAGASGHAVSFICEKYAYSMMDIEAFIGHSLPVLPIGEELLVAPENKPAFRERKPRDTRRGSRDKGQTRGAPKQYSRSPVKHTENHDDQLDKPMVKPALSPEDIEDSKYVPPPSTYSKRFGEIPAIG